MRSPAATDGRKAARDSREALRKAVDRLELVLLDRTIKAAQLDLELQTSWRTQGELSQQLEQARKDRDAAALQLGALRAKAGAL